MTKLIYKAFLIILLLATPFAYSQKKDPRSINITVTNDGKISFTCKEKSKEELKKIVYDALKKYGNDLPFHFKIDRRCKYSDLSQIISIMAELHVYKLFFLPKASTTCNTHSSLKFGFIGKNQINSIIKKQKAKDVLKISIEGNSYTLNGAKIKLTEINKIIAEKFKKEKQHPDDLKEYIYITPIKEAPLQENKKTKSPPSLPESNETIEVELKEIDIVEIKEMFPPDESSEDSYKETDMTVEQDQNIIIYCSKDTTFSTIVKLVHLVSQYDLMPILIKLEENDGTSGKQ